MLVRERSFGTSSDRRTRRSLHLRSQRKDRVDTSRAPGWKIRRHQRDGRERRRDDRVCHRIEWSDAEEESGHDASNHDGDADAENDAQRRERQPMTEKQPAHVCDLGAECHSQADLAGALSGGVASDCA
jgi:hypothetical protein